MYVVIELNVAAVGRQVYGPFKNESLAEDFKALKEENCGCSLKFCLERVNKW